MAVISLINEKIAELDDEIVSQTKHLEDEKKRITPWLTDYYRLVDLNKHEETIGDLGDFLEKFMISRPSMDKIIENGSMMIKEANIFESHPEDMRKVKQSNFVAFVRRIEPIYVKQQELNALREQQDLYKVLANQYLTEQTTLDSTLKELSDRLSRVEKTTGVVGGSAKKHTRKGRRPDSKRQKRPNTRKHY